MTPVAGGGAVMHLSPWAVDTTDMCKGCCASPRLKQRRIENGASAGRKHVLYAGEAHGACVEKEKRAQREPDV